MINRLEEWQVTTLIEYAEDYIKAVIRNESSEHEGDALALLNARTYLRMFLTDLIGEESDK